MSTALPPDYGNPSATSGPATAPVPSPGLAAPIHRPTPRSPTKGYAYALLATALAVIPLAMRRSSGGWILGRWSLPYFVILCTVGATVLFVGLLLARFGRRALFALAPIAAAGILGAVCTEIGGQLYAGSRPAHDVLFLQPDRDLGWIHVPGMELTWGGHEWYAIDFSVPMKFNSQGFRDREWVESKPAGVTRIALLGDSMVEAMQVPWEQTAGQMLERALYGKSAGVESPAGGVRQYEVLNFGVSNYGVGQCLLTWEHHARRYQPDYVFVLVAGFHMVRTVTAYEGGAFPGREQERLWIRPTFSLEGAGLALHPPADYERFVDLQRALIEGPFGGHRIKPKARRSFLLTRVLVPAYEGLVQLQQRRQRVARREVSVPGEALELNLRILTALGRAADKSGAKLVIVDICKYFDRADAPLSARLETLCRDESLGYVDLGEALIRANEAGESTRWPSDMHFNERGNQIFANAMLTWLLGTGGIADNKGR